jgi:hypothetical protein
MLLVILHVYRDVFKCVQFEKKDNLKVTKATIFLIFLIVLHVSKIILRIWMIKQWNNMKASPLKEL